MAARYPANLVTTTQLPDNAVTTTPTNGGSFDHATVHNQIADEIIAIEAELGTNASGSFADIKTAVAQQFIPVQVTFDVNSVGATTSATQNITISGLAIGDICVYAGCTTANPGSLVISARPVVTATNTVTLNLRNTDTAAHSLVGQTHLFLVSHQS